MKPDSREVTLKDLVNVQNGYAFESERFNSDHRGVPIIRIRDLAKGESETFYDGEYDSRYVVKRGDFLIGMDGEFRCYRWSGPDSLLNQRVCRLQDFGPEAVPSFVFYGINKHLERIEGQTDFVTVKHLSSRQIEAIRIPLPPLPEQKRIVRILDEAEELRRLRSEADRRTADLIPAIFHDMFGDPAKNQKSWPCNAIEQLCDLVRGSSPRPRSDPRYYGGPMPRLMIEDITRDGWFVTPKVDSLTEAGAKLSRPVKAGTIVMAVSGNIGLSAQLAVDACIHDGFVAFKELAEDVVDSQYFVFCLKFLRTTHEKRMAGAVFQNITTRDVKATRIPLPPLPLQRTFAARVAEARAMEAEQAQSRRRLDDLFQSLLSQAFEGES